MMTLFNDVMFPWLETASRNDQGVEPLVITDASPTTSETNVTFDAHGVNFYLRLGAIGTVAAVTIAILLIRSTYVGGLFSGPSLC